MANRISSRRAYMCCPIIADPDHDFTSDADRNAQLLASSRTRRRSSRSMAAQHLAHDCALMLAFRDRAEMRKRMRDLLQRLNVEFQTNFSKILHRSEEQDSSITLLNTFDNMKMERLQMDSKLRHLEVSYFKKFLFLYS